MIDIKWEQPSTQRGIVWVFASAIGFYMVATGKDPRSITSALDYFAMAFAGAMGVLKDDHAVKKLPDDIGNQQ